MTADDREAIARAAGDYIEGWFTGDADRMRRCLHPELAKRSLRTDGDPGLDNTSAAELVRGTGEGEGTRHPPGHEVAILDVHERIATVKVTSAPYVEYLHLARSGDAWLIVNVLWTRRAPPARAG